MPCFVFLLFLFMLLLLLFVGGGGRVVLNLSCVKGKVSEDKAG